MAMFNLKSSESLNTKTEVDQSFQIDLLSPALWDQEILLFLADYCIVTMTI